MVKRFVRKYKDFSKPCPKCNNTLQFDIQILRPSKYIICYECLNGCNLSYKEQYNYLSTEEKIIYYELEEKENV